MYSKYVSPADTLSFAVTELNVNILTPRREKFGKEAKQEQKHKMKQQQQKYQNTYYVSPPYLPTCQALYRHHVILQTIKVLLSTMLGNQSTLIKSVG